MGPAGTISRIPVRRGALESPLRRLRNFARLGAADEAAVRVLDMTRVGYAASDAISLPQRRTLLVASGWACTMRELPDRRRQIFCLILPGDVVGDGPGGHVCQSQTVVAVTPVQVVDATSLMQTDEEGRPQFPTIREAAMAARATLDSYLYDHIVRLGVSTAYERVGHLFAEVFDRLAAVGMTNGDQFLMPFTQEGLGEILGLSETHVNRTLRQLRQDGLLAMGPGWFALPDRARLHRDVCYRAPGLSPT
jgi:CRP-like cAMP-binding protein